MHGLPCQTLPTPPLPRAPMGALLRVLKALWAGAAALTSSRVPAAALAPALTCAPYLYPPAGAARPGPANHSHRACPAQPITATGHARPSHSRPACSLSAHFPELRSPFRPCLRRSESRSRPFPTVPSFPGKSSQPRPERGAPLGPSRAPEAPAAGCRSEAAPPPPPGAAPPGNGGAGPG